MAAIAAKIPRYAMVQHYFLAWRDGGVLERINFGAAAAGARSDRARTEPLGWRLDSQSVKDHRSRRAARSRCGEENQSRKRQLVTDSTGLPVGADVHRADIRDRDSAPLVTVAIHDLFPRLRHLFTVRAYAGERLRRALTKFGNSVTEIVPLMADTTGFKLLTRCWVATAFFSLAQSQSPLRKRFLRPP
jgi:putative transposase